MLIVLIPIQPDITGLQFNGGGMAFFEVLRHFKMNVPAELRDYSVRGHLWTVKGISVLNSWLDRVRTELEEYDLILDTPETDAPCVALNAGNNLGERMNNCPP